MRSLPLLAAALLAIALAPGPAAAQDLCAADAAWQARAGWGDVPCTAATEGAGFHVVQTLAFQHTNGTATTVTLHQPAGMEAGEASCTCGALPTVSGQDVTFTVPASKATGSFTATVAAHSPGTEAAGVALQPPTAASHLVRLYVPDGMTAFAPGEPDGSVGCAQGGCTVLSFDRAITWFTIVPRSAATVAPVETQNPWLFAGMGFLVGVVVWGMLVAKGVVQRKRKQEVAVAAHKEAAATESVPVLETRKRALMAALKEVEVARMQNEIDVATFEQVKADLKRQTVTVLRAIEEAHAAELAKEKA